MVSLQGKPALSMGKGCKNYKEPLHMLWIKPCNIYRLRRNPMIIIGFPRNLEILQGFPTTGKTCKDPVMPCKHLQCIFSHINWLVNICSVLKLVKWTLIFQTKEVFVALTPPSSRVNFSKTQPSFPILILEKDFHLPTLETVFCEKLFNENYSDLFWMHYPYFSVIIFGKIFPIILNLQRKIIL